MQLQSKNLLFFILCKNLNCINLTVQQICIFDYCNLLTMKTKKKTYTNHSKKKKGSLPSKNPENNNK